MNTKSLTHTITICFFFLYSTVEAQPYDQYCVMNGVDNWIEVSDNSSLDFSDEVTVDAWIKLCDLEGNLLIASKNHCSGDRLSYYFSINEGRLFWRWSSDGACTIGNSSAGSSFQSKNIEITLDKWFHVAVSHSPTSVRMFVNSNEVEGELIRGSFSSLYQSNVPLKIGVYQKIDNTLSNYFPGMMDNFRIWDYAMVQTDINEIFANYIAGKENNLMVDFDMEVVSNGRLINMSNLGAVNDGEINGNIGPWFIDSFDFDLGNDTIVCEVSSLALNIDHIQGASILWNDGVQTFDRTFNQDGSYSAIYTLGYCQLFDTLHIDIQENLEVELGNDLTFCEEIPVTLGKEYPNATYKWQDGSEEATIEVSQSGIYWVRVESFCGVSSDTVSIEFVEPPSIDIGEDMAIFCDNFPVLLEATNDFGNYTWHDGSTNPTVEVNKPGVYWVSVENACGVFRDSITINSIEFSDIEIPNVFTPNGDNLMSILL